MHVKERPVSIKCQELNISLHLLFLPSPINLPKEGKGAKQLEKLCPSGLTVSLIRSMAVTARGSPTSSTNRIPMNSLLGSVLKVAASSIRKRGLPRPHRGCNPLFCYPNRPLGLSFYLPTGHIILVTYIFRFVKWPSVFDKANLCLIPLHK